MLKKYITYAKLHCRPKLQNIDRDRIAKLYAQLRKSSRKGGGMPMGVRHLESILRMSEAHAKMHLRSYVREEDVNVAIRVMLDSFIGSQKLTVAKQLRQVCFMIKFKY
jgi:DNA replication licensing factor MCM2